jgi:hypothetical protein
VEGSVEAFALKGSLEDSAIISALGLRIGPIFQQQLYYVFMALV